MVLPGFLRGPTLEQAFDIRLELRPVLSRLGELRLVLARLREAEALAERLDEDSRRGRACAFMTNTHSQLGELDEALASGSRALEIAGRLEDVRLRILTTSFLEQAHYFRGEYERAVSSPTATSASASSTGRTGQRQDAEKHLATATTMYGEMDMPFWLEQGQAEMRTWA